MPTNNTQPYEVISAPFQVYTAVTGSAFPKIEDTPSSPWTLLGTSGNLNYMDSGITVSHTEEVAEWRSLGDIGTRKVFRTSEGLKIKLVLADISLEQYKHALNENSVTDVPPATDAGYRKIGLSKGPFVSQVALILRGPSPYGDGMYMQYQIPFVFQTGSQEVVYANSGEPAGLSLEFTASIDPNAASSAERFGTIIAQDAAALS